jgi:hypothetical protein
MLLPDLGPHNLRNGTPPDEWGRILQLLAWMQRECVGRADDLKRAGCGARGLSPMAEEIDALCGDERILSMLKPDERSGLLNAAPLLKELCARLSRYAVPETLTHGDFHGGNITRTDGRHIVFDWTDAAISHPFLDLSIILNWDVPPASPDHARIRDTYLAEWTEWESMERLREAMQIAFPLASLYQVLSHRRMLRAMGEKAEGDLKSELGMWVRRALSALPQAI